MDAFSYLPIDESLCCCDADDLDRREEAWELKALDYYIQHREEQCLSNDYLAT